MRAIRYNCRTEHCPNWMVLHEDQELPRDWTCQACEDALLTLQLNEMERREMERRANVQDQIDDTFERGVLAGLWDREGRMILSAPAILSRIKTD